MNRRKAARQKAQHEDKPTTKLSGQDRTTEFTSPDSFQLLCIPDQFFHMAPEPLHFLGLWLSKSRHRFCSGFRVLSDILLVTCLALLGLQMLASVLFICLYVDTESLQFVLLWYI